MLLAGDPDKAVRTARMRKLQLRNFVEYVVN